MTSDALNIILRDWVADKEKNGIKQHDKQWKDDRVYAIGGSSISVIQGNNPFSNIYKLISNKIGLTKFEMDIKPLWGLLFEDVIKRYVEYDRKCVILGEDLYIRGPPNTCYSPDGVAVMDIELETMSEEETIVDTPNGSQRRVEMVIKKAISAAIVLCEFKCPYSRIPSGRVPAYYTPQVKMGLDILKLPTVGLFIEGVFRRCTWEQLGNNPLFDRTLVPRSSGKLPIAYGVIGFYFDKSAFERELVRVAAECAHEHAPLIQQKSQLWEMYDNHYVEKGEKDNNFISNDLGSAPIDLFTLIMTAYNNKILIPYYGSIIISSQPDSDAILNDDMSKFIQYCTDGEFINFGIFPWKLFRIDYHIIHPEENYIQPWLPKINEIIDVVRRCNDPANETIKQNIYNSYVNSCGGFSDS